ncbi:class I SAM-dependent methyltransferase [Nocardioides sp. SYSU DS0651]|uniref:class I SAM-dependent methyltransferase n=1 Tax=Nocardioides sp. SYSU DS0651 TaxID=3415955 RepID=UPI003F4C9075
MTSVDTTGLLLAARGDDRVVDVLFDDRRIWSFWLRRDTVQQASGLLLAPWPDRMVRFLDGRSRITVQEHVSEAVLFDGEVAFGDSDDRIAFVNNRGLEISLDKAGRFSPTFSVRSDDQLVPLLDAMETVVAMLGDLGVTAFPAYGTLLGAVREGTFLGHDSDADLGYVSAHSTPVDVVRESFVLQRRINERGFRTYRYSGGAFRIDVAEADGSVRGLDLFGGFFDHDRLYLLGEVGVPFERHWMEPFGTCSLMGREFTAPARPEKLLEAMYGPTWQVPDPAYKFETPAAVTSRFNDWFRGSAVWRRDWERELLATAGRTPARRPSGLARLAEQQAAPGTTILDVGCGNGRDALWLARRGFRTTAYDYVPRAARGALRAAEKEQLALESRPLNLTEWRSVLAECARVAREPGPRVMLARHVFDATNRVGRDSLGRFASVALRGGGRLYADVWTGEGEPDLGLRPLALERVVEVVERHGGAVVSTERLGPGADRPRGIGRLVAEWG